MLPAQSARKSPAEADLDGTKAWWISSDNPKRQAKTIVIIFIFVRDQNGFSAIRSLAARNARRAQTLK